MKLKLACAVMSITLCFSSAQAQQIVPIGNDNLEFTLPQGYKQVSRNEEVPRYGYANASKTAFIEIFVPRNLLVPEDIEKQKELVIGITELTVPKLKWLKQEIINCNGMKWIQLSYEAKGKTNILFRNDTYVASLNNEVVYVTFLTDTSVYDRYKDNQHSVLKSIKFNRKAASNKSLQRTFIPLRFMKAAEVQRSASVE